MYKFKLGQKVYKLETFCNYFYVKVGVVKGYIIYPNNTIRYKIDAFNFSGEFTEHELLTKEEVSIKLDKWLS